MAMTAKGITKLGFEVLADGLKDMLAKCNEDFTKEDWKRHVFALCDFYEKSRNPNFDRYTFCRECGMIGSDGSLL